MIELKPKTWNYNLETTFFSYLREERCDLLVRTGGTRDGREDLTLLINGLLFTFLFLSFPSCGQSHKYGRKGRVSYLPRTRVIYILFFNVGHSVFE